MYKRKVAYSYSCLMARLPKTLANKVREYAASIPDRCIYDSGNGEQGREKDPHITIKYGIHTTDVKEIMDVLNGQVPFRVRLGRITSFLTEKYIVLKIGVQSEELMALNKKVCKLLECTDTFPEYKPHITIAYLRKNEKNPYYFQDYFNSHLDGIEVMIDELVFSTPGSNKQVISLEGMGQLANELIKIADVLTKV